MAVNCWSTPAGKVGVFGVMVMEDNVAAFTVRVVAPITPPGLAVMVTAPGETDVARPVLVIVATAVLEELQVTSVVMSWLVPSE